MREKTAKGAGDHGEEAPSKRSRRRRGCGCSLLGLGLLLLLGATAGGYWSWTEIHRPGPGTVSRGSVFLVNPGESAGRILSRLERAGWIRSAFLARAYFRWGLHSPDLLAGEYEFDPTLSTVGILEKLRRGEIRTFPATLIEGLTLRESAEALAAAGVADASRLRTEFASPLRIAALDPAATDLEGYLFPDTYRFTHATSEREIADALIAAFRRQYESRVRSVRDADDKRPLRELVILASLVEKEAKLDSERPLIAAVYANRLRLGIGLYADPTIIYALKLLGRWDGNLRKSDLRMDSPWNTYRVLGPPPGPICSPGLASLIAAAQPARVDFLYFVSRNDGSHVFSETLAEHNRNVDRWQKRPWRERAASR
ncbi:MAG: endolytic transglycosylase MltG [Thermoanaerobaculia bacterium]